MASLKALVNGSGAAAKFMFVGAVCVVASLDVPGGRCEELYR